MKELQRAQEEARDCWGKGNNAENKIGGSGVEDFPRHPHHFCSQLFHIVVKAMIKVD